jgi:hypothetical protein
MMKPIVMAFGFALLFAACQASPQPASVETPSSEEPIATEQPAPPANEEPAEEEQEAAMPAHWGNPHPVALTPPKPFKEDPLRIRRRMDIDQLDQTIQRVTGGIAWTLGNNKVNQFVALAQTLGKPNFIDLTREDLEPTALFQKFLDDAARSVCAELTEAETAMVASERVLMVKVSPTDTWESNSEGVNQNLAYLLLRYHGRKVDVDDPELEQWRWLFQSASLVAKNSVTAWRTVCVGLMTHPYFYTY